MEKIPWFPPNVKTDAKALPELRTALIDLAAPGGGWETTEMWRTVAEISGTATTKGNVEILHTGPTGIAPDHLGRAVQFAGQRGMNSMDWYRRTLTDAQLVHVSPDLCDVIYSTATTVPLDLCPTVDMLPSPSGFALLGKEFWGTDAAADPEQTGEPIRVDAIAWGLSSLPPRNIDWDTADTEIDYTEKSISVASFRLLTDEMTDRLAAGMDALGGSHMWLPLGRTDMLVGEPIGQSLRPSEDPDNPDLDEAFRESTRLRHESMIEDRQLVNALWAVMRQKLVVDTEHVRADKPARKRMIRAGHTTSPDVVVVHLRDKAYSPSEGTGDGPSVRRHAVRSHWRWQAVGKNRAQRRLTLIPPHLRGGKPGDTPVNVERVIALDR